MKCEQCRQMIGEWLEAALDDGLSVDDVPDEVTAHAASCADCRARVEAAMIAAGRRSRPFPPHDLAERVKARVRDHAESRDRERFGGADDVRDGTPARRGGALRFAAGAAVIALVLFAGILIGRSLPGSSLAQEVGDAAVARSSEATEEAGDTDERATVVVEFRLEAPRASEVVVVGDWNGWDTQADPLRDPDGDGVWETTVRLHPGEEYQYQFLVDEETWLPDPSSPLSVEDGFGGMNSVLDI